MTFPTPLVSDLLNLSISDLTLRISGDSRVTVSTPFPCFQVLQRLHCRDCVTVSCVPACLPEPWWPVCASLVPASFWQMPRLPQLRPRNPALDLRLCALLSARKVPRR